MTRALKLTGTHTLLLSGASQRQDGLLDVTHLKGNALRVVTEKLLKNELVEEVVISFDQLFYRIDELENRIGLKITSAGLKAIGVDPEMADGDVLLATQSEENLQSTRPAMSESSTDIMPRASSKKAIVLSLLQREEGATIADMMSVTGWLPHSTRAALTGLRKQGHTLVKAKTQDGKTAYHLSENTSSASIAA
ncbi:DUF3489 domain-containing protein [Microvirga sp. 2YAF29]|uniref:DUF3489 domain-containing protein n=1 Tax=Microvirga sp. 2YAF29 TaxID=3233031 RepID=UPI003F9C4FE8